MRVPQEIIEEIREKERKCDLRKQAREQVDEYYSKIEHRFGALFVFCFFYLAPASRVVLSFFIDNVIVGWIVWLPIIGTGVCFFLFGVPYIQSELLRKYINELKYLYKKQAPEYYEALCWVEDLYSGRLKADE